MNSPALKVIPLGGLGEVGLNILVLECGPDILLIDCGVLFPDLAWLGLDLVLPDFTYLVENAKRIKALVITHGHEDHIGAIPFLLREVAVPKIYASSFASALIQEKCQEYGVIHQLKINPVVAGDTVQAGQFECEFIHVTHSTLESFALAIKTPHGLVIHSGDFKFDETPYCGPTSNKERFRELAQKEQPLLLLSDSTNSERCGHSRSESDITNEIEKLISDTKGAAIVTLFASNIHRVHQIMDIAERVGRKIFLSGRSMERYVNIALDQRHLPRKGNLIQPLENIEDFPRSKILVLSTGSQGEARSSLYRLAKDENRWIKIKTGDSVILSSRHIPGNEKAVNAIINQLFKLGADVFYEDVHSVHASGHAHQEEQLELLGYVRPKYFLPVHGEYRQLLLHKRTAEKSGFVSDGCHLIENGQIWEFDGLGAQIRPSGVPVGRKWYFQGEMGAFDGPPIKNRKAAARAGVIFVTCPVSKSERELRAAPLVKLGGFLGSERKLENLTEDIVKTCEQAFMNWSAHNEDGLTREQWVALAARRIFKRMFDKKPLVVVHFCK